MQLPGPSQNLSTRSSDSSGGVLQRRTRAIPKPRAGHPSRRPAPPPLVFPASPPTSSRPEQIIAKFEDLRSGETCCAGRERDGAASVGVRERRIKEIIWASPPRDDSPKRFRPAKNLRQQSPTS